ncbi:hypothetical protein MKQ70_32160 [Chitinophaga sedimenti]|uniref:hypothetical protein n=1 Tax=Chitinophaga sedimenti TaxID=2033606 RepID=UPI0020069AE4|nr:hypothetical protein [Chitinophaga sedimenti]MCK7559373.1 hypothetical protein [Chitinophaga sedimenti]
MDQERMVALCPVTMSSKDDFLFHCQLRAIAHNILLSKLTPQQAAGRDELPFTPDQLRQQFQYYPALLARSESIVTGSSFTFDFTAPKNKRIFGASRYEDTLQLRTLALRGLERRYGKGHQEALQRVEKELAIIEQLDFGAYFLITEDMVRYATTNGYPHVGRGSGANSIVAYCLGITNVCPIELNLYFERFLNPGRKTPPDFDIDFSHLHRENIFKYLFTRYGSEHTAMLGTCSTFKDRSTLREFAKIYGLDKSLIDRLISSPGELLSLNIPEVGKILRAFDRVPPDFPNQRSVHAGGVLISELPVNYYTACDLPLWAFGLHTLICTPQKRQDSKSWMY